MNTNNISTMGLNITAQNYKEVESIINIFHILNTNPFLNNNSLSIFNVTIYNYENVINSIDKLYRINAIEFSDWALINLQLGSSIVFE